MEKTLGRSAGRWNTSEHLKGQCLVCQETVHGGYFLPHMLVLSHLGSGLINKLFHTVALSVYHL